MMGLNIFQILGIGLALCIAVVVSVALLRRRIGRGPGVFWLVVWLLAAVTIAAPGLTSVVARFLGISRGADLVFYLAILAMMVGFFLTYARLRRLEASLTELTRYQAIRDARLPTTTDESAETPPTS